MKGRFVMSEKTPINARLFDFPELPPSVDNAVSNLTDAPTKGIGQTLSDLWYLIFGSISQKAEKKKMQYTIDLEKFRQQLTKEIDSIPVNKQVEPSIQVAAQALENSRYCISDETLRSMFANLISGTMNVDTASLAHPSFPEILKQLSSQDALLLQAIYLSGEEALPIASFQVRLSDDGYYILYENMFFIGNINFSSNEMSLSLSSLQRANLISIDYTKPIADDSVYNIYINTSECEAATKLASQPGYQKAQLKKGSLQLTSLGQAFCSICIKKN